MATVSQIQFGGQLPDGGFVVCGHPFQDAAEQGAGLERAMIRDRQMERSVHDVLVRRMAAGMWIRCGSD